MNIVYTKFKIPKKSGGFREILAPSEELKNEQRKILKELYEKGKNQISMYAYGFLPGRSIYDNARVHAGKKYILNIDIEDFFPSCKAKNAPSWLLNKLPSEKLNLLFYNGSLPQGAPTSPFVSNLYLSDLDRVLPVVLRVRISDDIRYSRYADDITISSNSKAIFSKVCFKIISNLLEYYGFKINRKKIRYMLPSSRQEVTGLVVNSGSPTVSRKIRRNLKAAVYNITTGKITPSQTELNHLKGRLAFCMQVPKHRQWAAQMLEKLGVKVNLNPLSQKPEVEDMFKNKVESFIKGEIKELPYNLVGSSDEAKIIVRSKGVSADVKLSYISKVPLNDLNWLAKKILHDEELIELFVVYAMENPIYFSFKMYRQIKSVLKIIMNKISPQKRACLLVAYPQLKEYITT